jgi:U3 small nucleolar RNA-associated protein 4
MTSSPKKMKKSAPETPTQEDPKIAGKTRSSGKKQSAKKQHRESIASAESGQDTPKSSNSKASFKSPSSGKAEKRNKKDVEEPESPPEPLLPDEQEQSGEPSKSPTHTPIVPPSMDINVHRIRHLDYHPKPILCIRATPHAGPASDSCVAISRDNGSVELKSVSQKFRTIATISGYREKQVNVLAWTCGGANATSPSTLVGASQDGTVFIVDFASGKFKGMIPSGGGGVFALASGSCSQLVAAGCEDGSVRIYRVDTQEGKLETISILPSTGSAVLSLAWARPDGVSGNTEHGTVIYAGVADGTIRRFDCHSSKTSGDDAASTWKSTLRMTVESFGRNISTRVWALAALADGTVVSGDSLGHVQFWDGDSGTLQQTFDQNENKADVLDLDVTNDGSKVFASGVDSRVVCIERPIVESTSTASSAESRKWIMTTAQRPHTHDVRAVAICREPLKFTHEGETTTTVKETLFTGGVDTKLCTYQVKGFQKTRPKTLYPWPTFSPISIATEARLLMIRREDRIHLHRLGPKQSDSLSSPVIIPDEDTLVGTLEVKSASNLKCTAISANGRFVALSDDSSLFLFALTFVQEKSGSTSMIPSRLPLKFSGKSPIAAMRFLSNEQLVLAESSGCIHIVALSGGGEDPQSDNDMDTDEVPKATLAQTIQPSSIDTKDGLKLPVHAISAMDDGSWFVTSSNGLCGGTGTIQVFRKDEGGVFRHWWDVPALEVPHSALTFLKSSPPQLAVACMDFALYVFDIQERRLSSWSEDAGYPVSKSLPAELRNRTDYPVRLAINPGAPSKLLMVRTLLLRNARNAWTLFPLA